MVIFEINLMPERISQYLKVNLDTMLQGMSNEQKCRAKEGGRVELKVQQPHRGTVGPVAVALSVNENWQLYKGGIFDDSTCTGYSINYWALAVGYSAENGTDYWIVRNSLGESWGEDGYIRMIRGKQVCNINQQPWYALL
uniref:Cathepsin L-like proteinase n=1 Tax=Diabrotica virgifera virgifera TaxID=50390 RepID=A0A6P7GBV5_DIAVI